MTTTHSYTFDKLGRIGDDECNLSQRNVQNAEFGSYSVQNYFLKYCGMKKPIEFATSQPNIFYNGGFGNFCGAGGCNIQSDSNLKIGSIQTHPKCRISLYQRPLPRCHTWGVVRATLSWNPNCSKETLLAVKRVAILFLKYLFSTRKMILCQA